MQMSQRRDEPATRQDRPGERGAPATYAAYAFRKDVAVRVRVQPAMLETEELREHGYGHGV